MKCIAIFMLTLAALSVSAATYTVKAGGGGSFATIQDCATAAVAGDTCTVFAGSYAERPSLANSGTGTNDVCTACITFQANPGDVVTVQGFTVFGNYIIIKGFTITEPTLSIGQSGIAADSTRTGIQILNNTITQVGPNNSCIGMVLSYATIRNNTISWCSALSSQVANSGNTAALTGTLTFTANSTTVTGSGTAFSTELQADDWIYIANGSNALQVASVTNNTTLVTKAVYAYLGGDNLSGAAKRVRGIGVANPHAASGISFLGDHILVDGNDISHVTNGIQLGSNAHHVVIRNNTYHDIYAGEVSESVQGGAPPQRDSLGCIETNNCDTHVDFIESTGGGNTDILIEGNTAKRIWGTGGAHTWFASAAAATDTRWISRFNQIYQMGNTYLANEVATSNPNGVSYWKDYNNTYIGSQQQGATAPSTGIAGCGGANGQNGSFINNLFYNDVNLAGTHTSTYYVWAAGDCSTGFASGHNLAYDTGCVSDKATCTGGAMASDAGNIYADPKLLATDGSTFALQGGSPALQAGGSLTTATSCSGTTLTVADTRYFSDGLGVTAADWVRVGTTNTRQIATVDSATQITLTASLTCSAEAADPVYLYKDSGGTVQLTGALPNIGAYQGNGATSINISGVTVGGVQTQ